MSGGTLRQRTLDLAIRFHGHLKIPSWLKRLAILLAAIIASGLIGYWLGYKHGYDSAGR